MTKTELKSVKFDPGYAKYITILSISLDLIYKKIDAIKNFNQKKMQFKMNYKNILRIVDNNVGFCLGSLLWAVYIKSLENSKIEGNPCLGDTFNKDESVEEIDYSIKFFDKLKKDVKYYLNQNYEINPVYIKILNLYREFLLLNMNFVNTKTTSDVVLPDKIKVPAKKELDTIKSKIDEVLETGNLLDLAEVLPLIYEE